MTYQTYNFTGFKEADILGNHNGSSFGGYGESFVMPEAATTNFSVTDNDSSLSGDSWCNEHANDRTGQYATIEDCDGNVLQQCYRLYAERVIHLQGSDGKTYTLVEIELEGGNAVGTGDDYFTFYDGVPPAGVTLTVVGRSNVTTNYLEYSDFWQDDKTANIDPVAQDDTATVMENGDRTTVFNLLSNDTDANNDELEIVEVNGQTVAFGEWFAGANGGEFCLLEDGSVDFRQGSTEFDFLAAGEELLTSFTYTISDGNGGFSTATATVTITGKNDGPVAVDDHFGTISEDAGKINIFPTGDRLIERNDYDVDGDELRVFAINGERPADGTGIEYGEAFAGSNGGMFTVLGPNGFVNFEATFDGNGDFDYLKEGETTTTSFEYTITDGNGGFDTATVSVTIEGKNDGPEAANDTATTEGTTTVTVDVLANDTDIDGDTLSISGVEDPSNGQVQIVDGKLVYTPDAGFSGTETFEYTITDDGGLTSTAQVSIDVEAAAQEPPVLADGTYTLGNHPVTGKIKDNVAGGQEFGLRLDGLLSGDSGSGNNTVFDFEHPDSEMFLSIDGDKIRIHGVTYGGRVDENGFDQTTTGLFEVDFTYHNSEFRNGDDDFFIDDSAEGTNTGYIKQLTGANAGTVTDLSDMAGEYPYTFQLGDGEDDTGLDGHDGVSGRGWLFQDGQIMKASDFLFTVKDPVEKVDLSINKEATNVTKVRTSYDASTGGWTNVSDDIAYGLDIMRYDITVTNHSDVTATGIRVQDIVPENIDLAQPGQTISDTGMGWNESGRTFDSRFYWGRAYQGSVDVVDPTNGSVTLVDPGTAPTGLTLAPGANYGLSEGSVTWELGEALAPGESVTLSYFGMREVYSAYDWKVGTEFVTEASITDVDQHDMNPDNDTDSARSWWISPITFDLNGDGIQTRSIDQGVKFDLLNTGEAINTGWISGEDGFLAVDNNGDGVISDRSELFGGGVGDGFAKLASFDSNSDGLVNAGDAQFAELKLWQDANENGLTDKGELISLESAGITDLNTAYKNVFSTDANGNIHGEVSTAVKNGSTIEMTDVYFQVAV